MVSPKQALLVTAVLTALLAGCQSATAPATHSICGGGTSSGSGNC